MEVLFKIFLFIHITAGATGLLSGTINLFRKKGDKKHKFIGNVFSYAMLTAGFSSLMLAIMHPNYFLFIVGMFTIYLTGTGKRYIHFKMLGENTKPTYIDWALTIMMLLTGSVFLILGLKQIFLEHYFGLVLVVFGFFSLRLVRCDFLNYNGKARAKNFWLLAHIQRMTGGYIAALTAFLVVNSNNIPIQLPGVFVWLVPTIIFVPFIVKWSKKYEVKKKVAAESK